MTDVPHTHPSTTTSPRSALSSRFDAAWRAYGLLSVLLALILFNAIFTDRFLTMQSLRLNLTQVATVAIVGVGMTLVIATGGIDLSVGSLMAISGALAPLIFLSDWGPLAVGWIGNITAFLVAVGVAGLFGVFNGVLIARFRVQPIIATLVLFISGRGIAQVITDGKLQTFNNPGFQFIGLGRIFGIPAQAYIMVVVVLVAAWVIRSTSFGRYILAVGGNESAARLAGVPASKVKTAVYAISGLLAGLAGLIAISINSASDANLIGMDMELNAIAAVAVGGTALTGGRAVVFGTLMGALILQLIRTTLIAHNIEDAIARVVTATAIVVALLIQRNRTA